VNQLFLQNMKVTDEDHRVFLQVVGAKDAYAVELDHTDAQHLESWLKHWNIKERKWKDKQATGYTKSNIPGEE